MNFESRFKDVSATTTINKIKEVLQNIELSTYEYWYDTGVSNIFSVRVGICGTNFYTHGKGSRKDYALASGYGELIEYLSNFVHYRSYNNFEFFTDTSFSNILVSDEILSDDFGYIPEQKKWLEYSHINLDRDDIKILESIKINNKLVNIPFYKYKSKEKMLIPLELLNIIYGTNGMVSGNSREEAYVHGICEIIERYVTFEVLNDPSKIKDITSYIRKEYKDLDKIIKDIESNGYTVMVKDCSLDKGFPVTMIILLDKKNLKYITNFGAHPCLKISVERCLTEVLQARNIDNIQCYMNNIYDDFSLNSDNVDKVFGDGSGIFSPKIFIDTQHHIPNCKFWNTEYNCNKEILNDLLMLIESLGYKLFYRDMSFLEINAYQIIIPGMSEVTVPNIKEVLYKRYDDTKLRLKLNSLRPESTSEELNSFLELLDKNNYESLADFINLPVDSNIFRIFSIDIVKSIVHILMNEYEKGYKVIHNYLTYLETEEAESDIIYYYKILTTILYFKKHNLDDKNIESILTNFSDSKVFRECIDDIKRENVSNGLPKIICPNCSECNFENKCSFVYEKDIFNTFKEKQLLFTQNLVGSI